MNSGVKVVSYLRWQDLGECEQLAIKLCPFFLGRDLFCLVHLGEGCHAVVDSHAVYGFEASGRKGLSTIKLFVANYLYFTDSERVAVLESAKAKGLTISLR